MARPAPVIVNPKIVSPVVTVDVLGTVINANPVEWHYGTQAGELEPSSVLVSYRYDFSFGRWCWNAEVRGRHIRRDGDLGAPKTAEFRHNGSKAAPLWLLDFVAAQLPPDVPNLRIPRSTA